MTAEIIATPNEVLSIHSFCGQGTTKLCYTLQYLQK